MLTDKDLIKSTNELTRVVKHKVVSIKDRPPSVVMEVQEKIITILLGVIESFVEYIETDRG